MIVAGGLWVGWPALHGEWLWDDNSEITTNADLRGSFSAVWFSPKSPDYFPLKTTVQWWQWRAWGARSTTGYHCTTLALHLAAALLLWRACAQLDLRHPWIAGLLFAVHPLSVESVAWIAEMKNTLSLALLLGAANAFLRFDRSGSRGAYTIAVLLFLAAMLAKSTVAFFPCVLLIHAWWRRGRVTRRDVMVAAPFFLIAVILGAVTVWFQQHRAIADWTLPTTTLAARVLVAAQAVGFYFGKSFWPAATSPIYPELTVLHGALALGFAALLMVAWTTRRSWGRHCLFGAAFFVLALLPTVGLVPMSYAHIAPVADHFAYLSLVAWAGLAAAIFGTLRAGPVLGVIAAVVFAIIARSDAVHYATAESYWRHALSRNPDAWLAHNNLGVVFLGRERWDEARGEFEAALRRKPDFVEARLNLALTLARTGQRQTAMELYASAVAFDPRSHVAEINWGNLLSEVGRFEEAIVHYEKALRLVPDAADAHFNLANALVRLQRWAEAEPHYASTIRLLPDSAEAQLNFGNLLAATGRLAEARPRFADAARLAPSSVEAHYCLADALAQTGHASDSIPEYRLALKLDPTRADVHASLGAVLMESGRFSEAAESFGEVVRLDPNDADARAKLAEARRRAAGRPQL